MTIDRRELLKYGASGAALAAVPVAVWAQAGSGALFAPTPGDWRTYELTTRVEILNPQGETQVWVPVPAFSGAGWIKPGETTFQTKSGKAEIVRDAKSGARLVHVAWSANEPQPEVTAVSRFTVRDLKVDPSKSDPAVKLSPEQRRYYTSSTSTLRLAGIVTETATKITAGASNDLDKARRIYEWIVDNTARNPKTRGCGTGDIESMLKSGNLTGKCADLNALYVGLARAAGLPARDLYGIRVAPSAFGYKSLGAGTANVTRAQHCRADVFVDGIGWLPADPADVRKVMLEEPPGNLAADDPKVKAARAALFGSWEMNWLAYNDAHDVALPGSKGPPVPFLMYPQAETARGRLDELDPDTFKYTITARQIRA
ncbi:MAG: transglutaminase-like domain-containing protein [Hyphomicrobiaceae bacterium]